uniref:Uncharacterized protein n=1 Tax=Nymphaea colorata TaxID=210225 RepID=A0A5K1EKF9_9MAGN
MLLLYEYESIAKRKGIREIIRNIEY